MLNLQVSIKLYLTLVEWGLWGWKESSVSPDSDDDNSWKLAFAVGDAASLTDFLGDLLISTRGVKLFF